MRKKLERQMIKIPEYIAVERLKKYIDECDNDELARLLGDIFGGTCFQDAEADVYNFEPDKYYNGEFDDITKDTKLIESIRLKK